MTLRLAWDWPKGQMAWFLWAWRPSFFPDTRYWRVGPLTVVVVDGGGGRATQ